MSTTNHTTNYELSQYIGTDVTSYLSNYNSDMFKIDAQMKVNATAAASAQSDASAAVSAATSAAINAGAAVSTANAANTAAEAAQTAATAAQTAAGAAQTDAAAALRASASNTIGNLAPAYDPTLTYAVGDLVTYVDPETNQGKLYKCIVAIADPEEFNINKWDDVTTSEVYAPKEELLGTFTGDGVKTISDLIFWIRDLLLVDPIGCKNAHLYRLADNGIKGLYRVSEINDNIVAMSNINTSASATGSDMFVNVMAAKKQTDNTWLTLTTVYGVNSSGTLSPTYTWSPTTPIENGLTYYLVK